MLFRMPAKWSSLVSLLLRQIVFFPPLKFLASLYHYGLNIQYILCFCLCLQRISWTRQDYIPPGSALGDILDLCFQNGLEIPEIPQLLDLILDARRLYSIYYINGRGFILGNKKVDPGTIRDMVADPHGLKPHLLGRRGVYLKLEEGLLFCCTAVCQSQLGGGTLFTFITSRLRDGVPRHCSILKWSLALQK